MNALVSFNLCTVSNEELISLVDKATDEMFINQKVPSRHIPARPNSDYDLLVGELIKRFDELEKENKELKTAIIKHVLDSLKIDLFPIGQDVDYETLKQRLFENSNK